MSLDTYRQIVANSHASFQPSGFSGDFDLPSAMFPHQRASVEFALRGGSNALFLDTGLGKTLCALAWGQEFEHAMFSREKFVKTLNHEGSKLMQKKGGE